MGVAQAVLERLQELPDQEQQTVLSFVEFLASRRERATPVRSVKGALSGLGVVLSAGEIVRARKETWQSLGERDVS